MLDDSVPEPRIPDEPTERVVEQAFFHIADGGLTLSIVEQTWPDDAEKRYRFEHKTSGPGFESEGSFPLGSSELVSWMTMALNRISMRVTGKGAERSWQSGFEAPKTERVWDEPIKQAALARRIADKFKSFK